MTERRLPPPVMPTDEYLAAVHDRLGQINDRLGELLDRLPERPTKERPADGTVELAEPKRPARASGKAQGGGGGKRTPAGGGAPRPARRTTNNSKKND